MCLVGAMSGLGAWLVTTIVVSAVGLSQSTLLPDLIASAVLGMFLGGMAVGFSDRWSGNRTQPRFAIAGALTGLAAGGVASLLQWPIDAHIGQQSPLVARVSAWLLAGSLIGLGLGMRWFSVNPLRPVHAFVGGLVGGGLGGLLFSSVGSNAPDLSQATGFVLTGAGICFGITVTPMLLQAATLQFVSSGDARAHSKFGLASKEWDVQNGDSCLIGSRSAELSPTRYKPEIEIFIPDTRIAPRHAKLLAKNGRFFLCRHPDIASAGGLAHYVLRVRGRSVTDTAELHNNDDILIGHTALRFIAKTSGVGRGGK